jgi:c-di-GMP-binding flagellar brake protein YcgR
MRIKIDNQLILTEGKIRNIVDKEDKVCVGVEFIELGKEYQTILAEFISKKQMELIQQYKKQKG